jgi:phage terminase small subunit
MAGVKGRSGGWNRQSPEIHRLNGTFRADRHGTAANPAIIALPTAVTDAPPAPSGLSPGSRKTWRALMDEYEAWTPSDLKILALALEACDRAAQCRRRIAKDGLVLIGNVGTRRGSRQVKAHPLIRVERQAAAFAAGAFKQLNLGRDDSLA